MTQVKWKFEGGTVYFVSPKEKVERHALNIGGKSGVNPKIEIIDDNFTLPESYNAGCASCSRSSSASSQSTVSVYSEETKSFVVEDLEDYKSRQTSSELLGVFVDVDPTDSPVDLLPDSDTPSDLDLPSDGLDSEPIG